MPFKSEKQRKWMHANEPEMADKWEKEEESVNLSEGNKFDDVYKDYGFEVEKKSGGLTYWAHYGSDISGHKNSYIRGELSGWTDGKKAAVGDDRGRQSFSNPKAMAKWFEKNFKMKKESVNEAKGVEVARRVTLNLPDKKTGMDMETAKKILDIDAAYSRTPSLQKQFRKMEVKKMLKMMKNYYWEALDKKLYDIIIEQTKRDYKAEYKKYGSSTKAKKYRAELNKYNRQKGTYGNGDGKDASHKGGKIVGFEAESKNRGRAEKSRLKKEARAILEADFTDDTLASRIKHWSKQHKGTGIGYGHVLGHLAVHMKEMGWNKSYKEVARIAVELGKKKKVESIQNESGLQYRMGVKRYGKDGMKKIQSAAGSGADHAEIGAIKDKYDKKKKKKKKESVNEAGVWTDKDWRIAHGIFIKNKFFPTMQKNFEKAIKDKDVHNLTYAIEGIIRYMRNAPKKQLGMKIKESINEELQNSQGEQIDFKKGDIVKDINPDCPHVGSEGEVTKVGNGTITFKVTNNGKRYKEGDELEKTVNQMVKLKESIIVDLLSDMVREELEKYEGGYSKKWNSQRKKNAEVLGYKLSGKSDIKESAVSFWQDMFRPGPIPKQYINQLIKKKGELPSKSHIKKIYKDNGNPSSSELAKSWKQLTKEKYVRAASGMWRWNADFTGWESVSEAKKPRYTKDGKLIITKARWLRLPDYAKLRKKGVEHVLGSDPKKKGRSKYIPVQIESINYDKWINEGFDKYSLNNLLDSKLKKRLERTINIIGGKVDAVGDDYIKFRIGSMDLAKLPSVITKLDRNKNVWIGDRRKINVWDRKQNIDKLNEGSTIPSAGAKAHVDDGPRYWWGDRGSYESHQDKIAGKLGWEVVDWIMNKNTKMWGNADPKSADYPGKFDINLYKGKDVDPGGPTGAVSYAPTGMTGKKGGTQVFEVDNMAKGFSLWEDHIKFVLKNLGWEIIDYMGAEGVLMNTVPEKDHPDDTPHDRKSEKGKVAEAMTATPPAYSSSEAQKHVDRDVTIMSRFIGKASQQVIKTMMDGVKSGKYDAMDLQRGFQYGPVKRTHFGEMPFIQQLWRKVRDGFRRYSKDRKLR